MQGAIAGSRRLLVQFHLPNWVFVVMRDVYYIIRAYEGYYT